MPEHCTFLRTLGRGLGAWFPTKFLHFGATQVGSEAISRPLEMPLVVNQE